MVYDASLRLHGIISIHSNGTALKQLNPLLCGFNYILRLPVYTYHSRFLACLVDRDYPNNTFISFAIDIGFNGKGANRFVQVSNLTCRVTQTELYGECRESEVILNHLVTTCHALKQKTCQCFNHKWFQLSTSTMGANCFLTIALE